MSKRSVLFKVLIIVFVLVAAVLVAWSIYEIVNKINNKEDGDPETKAGTYALINVQCDLLYKSSMYDTSYTSYAQKLQKGDVVVILSDYVPYSDKYVSVRVVFDGIAHTAESFADNSTGIVLREYIEVLDEVKTDLYPSAPKNLDLSGTDIIDNSLYLAYNLQDINPVLNTGASYTDGRLSLNCSGFIHLVMKLAGFDNGAYHSGSNYRTAYNLFNDGRFEKIYNALGDTPADINFVENDDGFKDYLSETLKRGDLIYFYTTDAERYDATSISHVAMYSGDGNMIHNSTPYGVLVENVWEFSSNSGVTSLLDNNYNNIIGIARLKDEFNTTDKIELDGALLDLPRVVENGIALNVEISTDSLLELDVDFTGKNYEKVTVKIEGTEISGEVTPKKNKLKLTVPLLGAFNLLLKTENSDFTPARVYIENFKTDG